MFHVKDGVYFTRRAEANFSESAFSIDIVVTVGEPEPHVCGSTIQRNMDRVLRVVQITPSMLASVMATMSARGETGETYREALDFLMKKANKNKRSWQMSEINQAKQIRAIEHTKERLDKALSVLQEAVSHVAYSFGPVLKNVPVAGSPDKAKVVGGCCDYETMVCRTEEGILGFAEELNQICQRSAV